jgi:hypothetical protein
LVGSTKSLSLDRARPVQGVTLGIIILDTRFQRFPGDIGYAGSFPFPVQYAIARGFSDGARIAADDRTLDIFAKAIDDLVELGVEGIGTSCGFLSIMQPQLQERSPVLIATSSLLQIPTLQRILPKNRTVGILTASKAALTSQHLEGVGVSGDIPIEGMPQDGAFLRNMAEGNMNISRRDQEEEVLAAARRLHAAAPDLGAIVLECTNLAPHSALIRQELGVPVYDVMSMLNWFHAGLRPRMYS